MPTRKRIVASLLALAIVCPQTARAVALSLISSLQFSHILSFEVQAVSPPATEFHPAIDGTPDIDQLQREAALVRAENPLNDSESVPHSDTEEAELIRDFVHEVNNVVGVIIALMEDITKKHGTKAGGPALRDLGDQVDHLQRRLRDIQMAEDSVTKQELFMSFFRKWPDSREAMQSLVSLIKRDPTLPEAKREVIDHTINKLEARINKYQGIRHIEDLNLHRVLEQTVKDSSLPIEMTLEFHPVPLLIRADQSELDQVIHNLLINASHAVAHRPDGKVVLRTKPNSDGKVLIIVQDNGTGIRPSDLPHIFEPLFTTKAPGKGTGIGLDVAAKIIKGVGGTIRAESTFGHGAMFIIELPQLNPLPISPMAEPKPKVLDLTMPNSKILIVEDNHTILKVIREALSSKGLESSAAFNGKDALIEMKKGKIVVVAINFDQSGILEGKKLIDTIREKYPHVEVVAMSSSQEAVKVMSVKSPEIRTLLKPIRMGVLVSLLKEIVESKTEPVGVVDQAKQLVGAAVTVVIGIGIGRLFSAEQAFPVMQAGSIGEFLSASLIMLGIAAVAKPSTIARHFLSAA